MNIRVILCMLSMVFLQGATCQSRPPPIPIEPFDTHNCAAACMRLQDLGCPEGLPLEDGTTCTRFCIETQQSGHALNPTCVMTMSSCAELAACTEPR